MSEPSVSVGLREIYDELQKTSHQMNNLSLRMERIENKIEKQENEQRDFRHKLTIQLISSVAIPVILAVLVFVSRGGGF